MGFNSITIPELVAWVKVLKRDPEINRTEEMLEELELIDDLLTLQKTHSLLTRKKPLRIQLEARIGKAIGHPGPDLNRR